LGFLAAALFSDYSGPTIVLLMAASFFLILLDMCAGLPFLMAVRPSERTEMSAVYSTYRDVSGVISPGVARVVLMFAPLPGVFAVTAMALVSTALLAKRLHPRLGEKNKSEQANFGESSAVQIFP
jgi:ACDE family multidrug resistance protein